jgi:hypothetical protein
MVRGDYPADSTVYLTRLPVAGATQSASSPMRILPTSPNPAGNVEAGSTMQTDERRADHVLADCTPPRQIPTAPSIDLRTRAQDRHRGAQVGKLALRIPRGDVADPATGRTRGGRMPV